MELEGGTQSESVLVAPKQQQHREAGIAGIISEAAESGSTFAERCTDSQQ